MTNLELLENLFRTEDINKAMKLEATSKKQMEQIENLEQNIELEKTRIDVYDLAHETSIQ